MTYDLHCIYITIASPPTVIWLWLGCLAIGWHLQCYSGLWLSDCSWWHLWPIFRRRKKKHHPLGSWVHLLTTIKVVVKSGPSWLMTTTVQDGKSGSNCGLKRRTTCIQSRETKLKEKFRRQQGKWGMFQEVFHYIQGSVIERACRKRNIATLALMKWVKHFETFYHYKVGGKCSCSIHTYACMH